MEFLLPFTFLVNPDLGLAILRLLVFAIVIVFLKDIVENRVAIKRRFKTKFKKHGALLSALTLGEAWIISIVVLISLFIGLLVQIGALIWAVYATVILLIKYATGEKIILPLSTEMGLISILICVALVTTTGGLYSFDLPF